MEKAPIGSPEYLSLLQEKEALELRLIDAEKELHANRNELISKRDVIASNEKALAEKDETIALLKDYLRQARHDRFGRKSEKGLLKDMGVFSFMDRLFDEGMELEEESLEESAEEPLKEPGKEKDLSQEKKERVRGNRKPLDPKLPREDIIHDLEEHLKTCKECACPLHKIGEAVSEQLEVIPAKIKVLRHIRIKYGCRCEGTVVLSPLPPQPIPKSMASPGLLSHVAVCKYADHLPLYRQEQIWKRVDVDLDRATLGRWMMQVGELVGPLIELMRQDILVSGYVQADETTLQVLSQKNRLSSQKSYMWVYKTGHEDPSKVLYEYCVTRGGDNVLKVLENFKGYLQTDAYVGYKSGLKGLDGIVSLGCMAHARRKFADIFKSAKKGIISGEAIARIAQIYGVEENAKEQSLNNEERKAFREKHARPLLESLKAWLEEKKTTTPPKSPLGNAISYSLNNWAELTGYLKDGRLQIDNNSCERTIKPFVIGRKNWLFSGNDRGAKAGANIYSLIETCKSYEINSFEYLRDIFIKLPKLIAEAEKKDLTRKDLENLLPYHWKSTTINA